MKRSKRNTLHTRLVRSHLLILLLSTVLITLIAAGTFYILLNRQAGNPPGTGWAEWRLWALFIIAVGLITALLIGFVFVRVRREIAPLNKLINGVEELARGEINSYTSNPDDPMELRRLVQAYNDMAERMQDTISEMRSFVAYASHELRTPLTSIKLRVEALRNGALDDPPITERFLSEIESEVDRLSRMVNDLLDLSRIEAGLGTNQLAPLNLEMVAAEVYDTYQARAERAGVKLTYHSDPYIPLILGEEDQLRRMFYNLVDNAIKYTPQDGSVELLLKSKLAESKVEFTVKDTGFGISKEHLPHIFDRFYRVEATRPRFGRSQGSGLGLAIARTIVEAHGGRIWVISQVGEGTAFGVEFPVLSDHREIKQ
jgi:signal transduction histidine kinase